MNNEDTKAYNSTYYKKHTERIKSRVKAYAHANRVAIAEKRRAKYASNPVRSTKSHEYYMRNKKACIARAAKYYEAAKETRGTPRRRAQMLTTSARTRAAERKIPFDLANEWVQFQLDLGVCELSGMKFEFALSGGRPHPFAPSLDRIDNSKGYTKGNCRIILWCLNLALNTWGEDVMLPVWRAILLRKDA